MDERGASVIEEQPYEEDGSGMDLDPEDPYQINRINVIPHEELKDLYNQVVEELLDLQLDFEEKLQEVEDESQEKL